MIRLSALISRFEPLDKACDGLRGLVPHATILHSLADSEEVWVHHGDLVIPGDLDADISLVVTGDLIVDGIYDDYLGSVGCTLVKGSFMAGHVRTWGALHVCGDAMVHGVLYADYNDFELHVEGLTCARCLIVADHSCILLRAQGVPQIDWNDGVQAKDLRAVFSESASSRLLDEDAADEDWVDVPKWGAIEALIRCGDDIWRTGPPRTD